MSYTCYLGGALWPTPEKLQVKIKGKNKTLVLLNEGEVNFLRAPGLTEITVPFDLPMLTGSQSPDYFLGLLERMKTNKETTQFMLVRVSPSGGMLFDTNIKVSVEDYTITEDGKNGLDVAVDVNLKQWRDYGTKIIEIATNPGDKQVSISKDPPVTALSIGTVVRFTGDRHYISSTGDTGYPASPGLAKITSINPGSKHPYHLIHIDNTSNVYGWVNKQDIITSVEQTITIQKEREARTAPTAKTYTVKAGDCLWAIAAKYYGNGADYTKIYNANTDKISNPNLIYVGQVLTIP